MSDDTIIGLTVRLVIDDSMKDEYTSGGCWRLAWAIHELTGWPMVAVGYNGDMGVGWSHVLNERPDGTLVDIHGLRHPGDVIDQYEPFLADDVGFPGEADLISIPADQFEWLLWESPDDVTHSDYRIAMAVLEGLS